MPQPGQALSQDLSWLDWSNLRCELLWIYDGVVHQNHLVLKDFMPGQSAYLIRKGSVAVSTAEGEMSAGPGHWLFLKEGSRTQKFSADSQILSIRFYSTWPGRQPLFDWDVGVLIEAAEAPELEASAKKLEQVVRRKYPRANIELRSASSDVASYLEVQRRFLSWLQHYADALFARGHPISRFEIADPRILRAVRIIDHHPLQQPFRETDLAAQVNLSASQLGRLFIGQFGISPCRYFERRKFEEAIARVRASSCSIKSIAIDLGFSSLPHFSSWFRRKTNMPPNGLRQKSLPQHSFIP